MRLTTQLITASGQSDADGHNTSPEWRSHERAAPSPPVWGLAADPAAVVVLLTNLGLCLPVVWETSI